MEGGKEREEEAGDPVSFSRVCPPRLNFLPVSLTFKRFYHLSKHMLRTQV
jgi:hypothetical protein